MAVVDITFTDVVLEAITHGATVAVTGVITVDYSTTGVPTVTGSTLVAHLPGGG
jgi:hypothetical protein